ncbi:MAG TPA: DUF29 domain-containing protein [Methylococcus sp.]|nr:DUF29 domain-containing protein [Methylococcus sp.]
MSANLYEIDRAAWLEKQAALLKAGKLSDIDTTHLIEELEAEMGNYKRELYRRFRVLIAHLLKWKYQPDQRSPSWKGTIRIQRRDIERLLKENPSLRRFVKEEIENAYPEAVELAADETALLEDIFPASCEWEEAEIMDPNFWPE